MGGGPLYQARVAFSSQDFTNPLTSEHAFAVASGLPTGSLLSSNYVKEQPPDYHKIGNSLVRHYLYFHLWVFPLTKRKDAADQIRASAFVQKLWRDKIARLRD
jgi:hypothetical protein